MIGLSVATMALSGITGSPSGAIGIVMNDFIGDYLALGIDPQLLHRIVVIASGALTAMPQSGVTITFQNLSGLSVRRGFIHQFLIINGLHLLGLIVMLILSAIFY